MMETDDEIKATARSPRLGELSQLIEIQKDLLARSEMCIQMIESIAEDHGINRFSHEFLAKIDCAIKLGHYDPLAADPLYTIRMQESLLRTCFELISEADVIFKKSGVNIFPDPLLGEIVVLIPDLVDEFTAQTPD